jgi:hypothetical protein
MDAGWVVLALWAAVGVVLLLAWVGFARRHVRALPHRRRARAVARFAAEHGWRYVKQQWLDVGVGVPFVPGESGPCTNVVAGVWNGQSFTAFEYAHESQVFMVDMPRELPFLEIRSRAVFDAVDPGKRPMIELESDEFNQRFAVVADSSRYAAAALQPRLMEILLSAPEMSWRILGRRLVGWADGSLDPALIASAVDTLRAIQDAIPRFVWDDYATSQGD